MQGEQQAIMRVAPAPFGSGDINAAQDTTVGTSSTVAVAIPQAGAGCWITITIVGAVATDVVRMAFGDANVGAAGTSDKAFFHGDTQDYWVRPGWTSFRAIATSAACHISWHRSSP